MKTELSYSRQNPIPTSALPGCALMFAQDAHAGQVDKGGKPYVDHVMYVGAALHPFGPHVEAAGYLHDVIEDTDVTAEDLLDAGFPECVVQIVQAVTRPSGQSRPSYLDFITSITASPCEIRDAAVLVKLADNLHNSSVQRLAALDAKTSETLANRYTQARRILRPYASTEDLALLISRLWR